MKKFFMMAVIALSAVACSNDSELTNAVENNAEQGYAPVTVRVADFSITQEEMPSGGSTTRAAENPADYEYVGAITLAFYDANGSESYKTTQVKGDGSYTTFGQFSCDLPIGAYTMVVIARYVGTDDVFTLTSPTEAAFTSEKPRETFCKTQNIVVTTAGVDLNVTLNRISSWLSVVSTDGRPANATKIRTTFAKGGKSFNPTTGLSLTDTGFSQIGNPTTAAGAEITVNSVPFLYTDEESMNVTIEVLDASDHVLFSHTVENVPFQRNRKTTVRGNIFTASTSSAAFKLETSWLDEPDPINF